MIGFFKFYIKPRDCYSNNHWVRMVQEKNKMRLKNEIIGLIFLLYADNMIWLCNAPLSYALVANVVLVAIYFGLLLFFKKIGGFENE